MSKRILDYDPFSGITTTFDYIESEDRTVIGREQDCSLILEANKVLQNEDEVWKRGVKQSWAHYCQVPNIIIEKWKKDHGVDFFNKDHEKAWLKLVNQPEYRYLKTTTKMHRG